MFGFRKCTEFLLMLILSLPGLLQNRSLETILVCIVVLFFPHDNITRNHMCDGCKKSNEIIVCHKLWSIFDRSCKICSLTTEYRVFQYVPSISMSGQLGSILLKILPRISILLLWNDGRQCTVLIPCRVVESFYLQIHNIVPHISWHDLPCHMTTKKYADFPSMVIFPLLQRKFWIQTWFCNCPQYPCLFHIAFDYIPGFHDQRKMLVLANQLLC